MHDTNTYKIVETDNFDSDYPDEKFVEPLPPLTHDQAVGVCAAINFTTDLRRPLTATRFWKVVKSDYKLQPGFEP